MRIVTLFDTGQITTNDNPTLNVLNVIGRTWKPSRGSRENSNDQARCIHGPAPALALR